MRSRWTTGLYSSTRDTTEGVTDRVNSSPEWIGQNTEERDAGKSASIIKAVGRMNERSSNEESDTRFQEKLLGVIV